MSRSKSAQTHLEVWETDYTSKYWQRIRHLLQLWVKCRKWADPMLKYLLKYVVSHADLMIEILTDSVPHFCWVIMKDFPDKVDIISRIEPSHLGIYLNRNYRDQAS